MILDPAAARMGAEQNDLEDPSAAGLFRELGLLRIPEFLENDFYDARKLVAFALGQVTKLFGYNQGKPRRKSSGNGVLHLSNRVWLGDE